MAQYANYGASYATGGYDPYANQGPYQGEYQDHPGQGPFDTPINYGDPRGQMPTGPAAYEGMHQGQHGYYFDPNDAGQYDEEQPPTHRQGGYDDPYAGYSGGEGSINTPPNERGDPLHVSYFD